MYTYTTWDVFRNIYGMNNMNVTMFRGLMTKSDIHIHIHTYSYIIYIPSHRRSSCWTCVKRARARVSVRRAAVRQVLSATGQSGWGPYITRPNVIASRNSALPVCSQPYFYPLEEKKKIRYIYTNFCSYNCMIDVQ